MLFKMIKNISCYTLIILSIAIIFGVVKKNAEDVNVQRYQLVNINQDIQATDLLLSAQTEQATPTNDEYVYGRDYQILALPFSITALVFAIIYLRNTKKNLD